MRSTRKGGQVGIDRIGLASAPALLTLGPLHLDHGQTRCGQGAGQSDAIGAGALQPTTSSAPGACSASHARAAA